MEVGVCVTLDRFHLPWWCSHNGENNSNDPTLLWFDVKMDVHFYISNGVYRFITHVRKTPQTLKVVCGCVLLCHYTRKLSVVEVIYTCKDISNTVLNVRGNICSQKMFDRRIVKLMAEHEQRGQCTWNDPHCAVTHAVRKHCTKTEKTISFCALGFFSLSHWRQQEENPFEYFLHCIWFAYQLSNTEW